MHAPSPETEQDLGTPALLAWGDFDGDQRLDIAAVTGAGALQLLASADEGRFEDVTERAGLAGVERAAFALWADYDGDSRLDLFVGARDGRSRLFRNEGGTFADMTDGSGLLSEGAVRSAHWLDHDGDGRLDLHVVTADENELFRGLEGGFFERTELPLAGGTPASFPVESPSAGAGVTADVADTAGTAGDGQPPASASANGNALRSAIRATTIPGTTPGGAERIVLPPQPAALCIPAIEDQSNPSTCIGASSVPTLGRLYPISANLFVAVGGNVGVGTTSPAARLDVAGTARVTDTLTLNPSGDQALDVASGNIYKFGLPFIHTKPSIANTAIGTNALSSASLTGTHNTAVGYTALSATTTGARNTAVGYRALASNTVGSGNTASGRSALASNTSGLNNTASGYAALSLNSTGSFNTGVGMAALRFGNGNYNTAIGGYALRSNGGSDNTASGAQALQSNTTGTSNTASGRLALFANTTGSRNTASGARALRYNTIGAANTASGYNALRNNVSGANNTATGAYALQNNTGSNNTAHGTSALRANGTGYLNTAVGASALRDNVGVRNTAVGGSALASNSTGSDNTATGTYALGLNNTGASNTAHGSAALLANTTGNGNTASGQSALYANTSGSYNTASGQSALRNNTIGTWNTASGGHALELNTGGYSNTANGKEALRNNTTGNNNTAVGVVALRSNTTGANNASLGVWALGNSTTGSNNVAVGAFAGFYTNGSNNVVIGNDGVSGENGTIRIGSVLHGRTYIAGIRGNAVLSNAIPVIVDSAGELGTTTSSRRFKEEIADMGDRTERLLALRPVVFRYKPEIQEGERALEYGLIAEEVAEVFPDLVVYDEEGKPFTVKYHLLASMLLNELKEMHETLEDHLQEHEDLSRGIARLRELEERLARVESGAAGATTARESAAAGD